MASAVSCGGSEMDARESGVHISYSSAALHADVTILRIAIHPGARSCKSLGSLSSSTHDTKASKILQVAFDGEASTTGQQAFNDLTDGSYSVVVYGFAAESDIEPGNNNAVGCTSGVQVSAGLLATVEIQVGPV